MSETKFTPGPWRIPTTSQCSVVDSQGRDVCQVSTGRDAEETIANGHLIKSAPDLYNALSFFVNAIGERRAGWEDISDTMLGTAERTALDDALAALAKARGEKECALA